MSAQMSVDEYPIYKLVHAETASMILTLSGLTLEAMNDAALELGMAYEFFCADYQGPELPDYYAGFAAMLRDCPIPWQHEDGIRVSSLSGFTLAQFYAAWAWEENNWAEYFLEGKAVAHGWEPNKAMSFGVSAALSAAKSLAHAHVLMATGNNPIAHEA